MKHAIIAAGVAAISLNSANGALVLTAVFDGDLSGGLPKGIELFATADIADLSAYGVGSANNGGGSDGEEFTLAGSASVGDYIYVASESSQFQTFFGFAPTFTSGSMGINGDDAIELFMDGSVIDVYGDINTDGSGESWEYADGWAYRSDDTGPDGSTFVQASWSSNNGELDGETTNASAANPVPIGTYSVTPIPEPLTVTAGLLGIGGIMLRRRSAV